MSRMFCRNLFMAFGLVIVAACSGSETAEPDNSGSADRVLVLVKTLDNPFFSSMVDGIEAEAGDRYKLTVRAGSNESDVTYQFGALERYFSEFVAPGEGEVAAIIITPASSGTELLGPIKKFRDAGVPVIVLDTPFDADALEAKSVTTNLFVGSNNFNGGELAGALVKGFVSEGDRVLLLNGAEQSQTAADRREGFLAALNTSSGIEVVERGASWRRPQARTTTASLLSFGEEFDAVFAANDEMALGALAAYTDSDAITPPIIGFDAIQEAREAVTSGQLFATIAQDPSAMGRASIRAIPSASNSVGAVELVPLKVVDGE